jgi:hypothetical protein
MENLDSLKFELIGFLHDTDRIQNDDSEIVRYPYLKN